jgi:hypothetical protein
MWAASRWPGPGLFRKLEVEVLKQGATLTTREPRVASDPRLPPGTYRVQLVVQGRRASSQPATLVLKVIDTTR